MLGGMATRKQTSARVSSIAGRVLRNLSGFKARGRIEALEPDFMARICSVADLRTLAAFALSQDETPRKVAKRGKR